MSDLPPMRPRFQTMAYSMVDQTREQKPRVDTTVEMHAVVDSVRTVITDLIERNIEAWKKLPLIMRDKMIREPNKFRFVWDQAKCGEDGPPKIIYNGVMIWFSGTWILETLVDD
jgi:hypothetical protein